MQQLFYLLLFWLGLVVSSAAGQAGQPAFAYPPPPHEGDMLVIANVNVVDVVTGELLPDQMVVVRGDIIISVGKWVPAREGVPYYDAKGRYLIPGLWDGRTHALTTAANERIALPLYVASGITSIRELDSARPADEVATTAQTVENGTRIGPHIELAGAVLDGSPTSSVLRTATRAQGYAKAMSLMQEDDWTKLQVGPQLPREAYFGAATAAREAGVPLTGQVPEAITMDEALSAGQRGYEYLDKLLLGCSRREAELVAARAACLQGPYPAARLAACIRAQQPLLATSFSAARCAKLAQRLAQAHAFVLPLLTAHAESSEDVLATDSLRYYVPLATRQQWEAAAARQRPLALHRQALAHTLDSLKHLVLNELQRQHVRLVAGSDAGLGSPHHLYGASLVRELERLVANGLTPVQALRAATIDAANATGHYFELGSIEPGYLADMVVLTANPLVDIRQVQRVEAVVLRGRLLDRAALTALATEAAQAAQAAQTTQPTSRYP